MCGVGVGIQPGGGKLDSSVTENSRFRLLSTGPHHQVFVIQSSQPLFLVAPGSTGLLHVNVTTWPSLRPFLLQMALSWSGPTPWP